MLIAYKIVITLVAIVHVIGFTMGAFFPASLVKEFGLEYNDSLHKLTVHFGLLLGIFSAYLILAAVWTFKGKREGIELGVVGGAGMLVAFILDLILVGQGMEKPLLVMGVLTTLTSQMALKK